MNEETGWQVVGPSTSYVGKQNLTFLVGISAESVGATGIHMQMVQIPTGGRAKAHMPEKHEPAICALSGMSHVSHGERLERHSVARPGEFFYIPAGIPRLLYNPSQKEETVAVVARTDPNEQESLVLLPHLGTDAVLRG
jgi:uncharacterized RmlC-like cupin family protein